MKNSFKNTMVATFVLLSFAINAQIKIQKLKQLKFMVTVECAKPKSKKAGTIKRSLKLIGIKKLKWQL